MMRLKLTYTSDLADKLHFLRQRLYVARSMVPSGYESYFQERARFWSAHTSTAIEGNPLTDEAAMLVLVEGEASEPPEQEKLNLDEAYELIEVWAAEKAMRVDEGIIRSINSMVLKGLPGPAADARGRYRLRTSAIVDAKARDIVRYYPPAPELVPELMTTFVRDVRHWAKEEQGPIAAALAHFGLISIHPFEDGNGRSARLLADLILSLKGWSADGMLSISGVIHGRISAYYEALREAQGTRFTEDVDVTPFIEFHTMALCDAAIDLEEKVVSFNLRRDQFISLTDGVLNQRQVTALMFMMDVGPLSSSVHARLTKTSQTSAQADLTGLAQTALVERVGAGKGTRYKLGKRLEADIEKARRDELDMATPSQSMRLL